MKETTSLDRRRSFTFCVQNSSLPDTIAARQMLSDQTSHFSLDSFLAMISDGWKAGIPTNVCTRPM